MHVFRSALSACVLRDLPNVEYYMPLDRDRLSEEGRRNIEWNSRHATAPDSEAVDNDSVATATITIRPAVRDQVINLVDDEEDDI